MSKSDRQTEQTDAEILWRFGEMNSDQGKLFIGGISWETTEEKLRDHFQTYGEVAEIVIMKDRATGRARGFGFVVFADPAVADRVVTEKHTIDGRTVRKGFPCLQCSRSRDDNVRIEKEHREEEERITCREKKQSNVMRKCSSRIRVCECVWRAGVWRGCVRCCVGCSKLYN